MQGLALTISTFFSVLWKYPDLFPNKWTDALLRSKVLRKKLRSFHLGLRVGCSEDSPFCSLGELRVEHGCSPSLVDLGTGLFQHTQGWSEFWRQIQPDSTHMKPMYKPEGQFILDNTHIMISIFTFCRNKNMGSLLIKCSFKMEKQTKGIFFFFFSDQVESHSRDPFCIGKNAWISEFKVPPPWTGNTRVLNCHSFL